MGVFNSLFGGKDKGPKKEEKIVPWVPLTAVNQLNEIEKRSKTKTQVIYKHSTTCGISRMVLNMFNSSYDIPENSLDLYYIDLHSYREVSNETGYKFQVMHQSPQLIVIKNGNVVAHASHGAISEIDLNTFI